MSGNRAGSSNGTHDVNMLVNRALAPGHSPVPCSQSKLNAHACSRAPAKPIENLTSTENGVQVPSEWPKDVVYITQNLVASSVPDAIAQTYLLSPSSSSAAPSSSQVAAGSSAYRHLPQATHNQGRPQTLYTASIQRQVPLVVHAIDQHTPWCPESFHSTSRNLSCHPAAGSFGLFAAQDIAPNTFLRPYLGVLHTKADADFYSTYDLSLCHDSRLANSRSSTSKDMVNHIESLSLEPQADAEWHNATALYLDSRYWGNESRFVNDYRGIAPKPNVEFRSFVQLGEDGQQRFQMGLFATRPVRKGQELLINYGKSFWVHFAQLNQRKIDNKGQTADQTPTEERTPDADANKAVDPIQAMLQRSRLRISKTSAAVQRRPHLVHPRT